MKPYYQTLFGDLYHGDCLEVMNSLPDNSVSSIVTDPPYALEFMGKGWDKVLPSIEVWRECLRVAKPGAILLAFGGTRTYHRLTCAIEDAGSYLPTGVFKGNHEPVVGAVSTKGQKYSPRFSHSQTLPPHLNGR